MNLILEIAGSFFTLFGLFVFIQTLVLPKKAPMDKSNRINHLRLVWFALKSPHKFVDLRTKKGRGTAFPWLKRDEGDNVDGQI